MSDGNLRASSIDSSDLQVSSVGQGFDIYGSIDVTSFIRPLFDFSSCPTKQVQFLGQTYEIPTAVDFTENTSTYYDECYSASREGVQEAFSASVGASGSYGGFSGEMQAAYASSYQSDSEYSYSYRNFYMQLGFLQLNNTTAYQSSDFANDVAQLPETVDASNLDAFSAFFEKYGAFYTSKVILGGRFDFYNAVSNQSSLDSSAISASMKAQYDGLFVSGSFDASVTQSATWSSYLQNSQIALRALGGDPALGAALTNTDTGSASSTTVAAYNNWIQSMDQDSAIVDFTLSGIWELCGERSNVVDQAWILYRDLMHPQITVTTQSSLLDYPFPTPNPPLVSLSSLPGPIPITNQPETASGWLVILIDCASDLSKPSCVSFAKYYCEPNDSSWMYSYANLYDMMAQDIEQTAPSNSTLLILASFGLDNNMVPTNAMQRVMAFFGASSVLAQWIASSGDPGSEGGPYIQYPSAYCLIGFGQGVPGTGIENLLSDNEGTLSTTAQLFRIRSNGGYTLGN